MANYHILQSKERDDADEETGNGTSAPLDTGSKQSKLSKYIAIFLAVCAITVSSFIAGCRFSSQFLSNGAAFTEDLSFLSMYLPSETIICLKPWLMETLAPFYLDPPGPITKTFTKDPRFRQPPSAESNEAWLSILPSTYVYSIPPFPHPRAEKKKSIKTQTEKFALCPTDGLGIIRHPSLLGTDEPVSLAFVHQLHCLVRSSPPLSSPLLSSIQPGSFPSRPFLMNRTESNRTKDGRRTGATRTLPWLR